MRAAHLFSTETGQCEEARFFYPGGAVHLAVAVLGKRRGEECA